ncbi:Lipopolysaccharide core heptose(I) kinase RfaP [Sinobacterium norvegicum]|uniref:Lipopolysaccharide core heptose(I) kinase RfaP n=1 Tax=Sinobacterium norvegicum TaxID=1641715 RepID=A0ABN8EKF8_9GAMM|nr:lipopolysaccharide core heptose(I) kinase RfaP [Sinobacterium norvegicum]CAH0992836.1 Lipopolysaccharide core heptose(I) kinase RfaP [Sinobacterium norvegicum]
MTLHLEKPFDSLWSTPFDAAIAQQGEIYRSKEGRRTLQFEAQGQSYFLKLHQGIGWGEIIKNLVQLRLPILGARNEWLAIEHLKSVDVGTMTAAAYGERGCNPAKQLSFIVTEDLIDTISLEDYCKDWVTSPPDTKLKVRLIKKVAEMSGKMHGSGMNHRDFYLCHFLLDETIAADSDEWPKLHIIDLHRAQIRAKVPYRWQVKDLAGLYYSALDIGLSKEDVALFLGSYSLDLDKKCRQQIERKAMKLYLKDHGRAAVLPK